MPRKVANTIKTMIPMSKLEVAQSILEMTQTPGWQHVFAPTLTRKRDQILREILKAEDLHKNFAAEITALQILNAILDTKDQHEALLAYLRKLSAE